MKKLFALFLALMMAAVCSGCFGEADPEIPESEEIQEQESMPDVLPDPEDIVTGGWILRPLETGEAEIVRYPGEAKELDIPEDIDGLRITAIGDRAFEKLDQLRRVSIPQSVTAIGVNPFMLCTQLKEITVAPGHPCFEIRDGVLYGREDRRLICYPCTFDAASFAIPEDVEIIGGMAFCRNEALAEISRPAGQRYKNR